MATHYIGADVHAATTDMAFERNQRIVKRLRVPTTIPAQREALASVAGIKRLVIEEGPVADWLWRNLKDDVEQMVVCDPRRRRRARRCSTRASGSSTTGRTGPCE